MRSRARATVCKLKVDINGGLASLYSRSEVMECSGNSAAAPDRTALLHFLGPLCAELVANLGNLIETGRGIFLCSYPSVQQCDSVTIAYGRQCSACANWLAPQRSAHIGSGVCTLHSLWNQELYRRRLRLVLGTAALQ